jgi:hypothetical protein
MSAIDTKDKIIVSGLLEQLNWGGMVVHTVLARNLIKLVSDMPTEELFRDVAILYGIYYVLGLGLHYAAVTRHDGLSTDWLISGAYAFQNESRLKNNKLAEFGFVAVSSFLTSLRGYVMNPVNFTANVLSKGDPNFVLANVAAGATAGFLTTVAGNLIIYSGQGEKLALKINKLTDDLVDMSLYGVENMYNKYQPQIDFLANTGIVF